jgi:hypothetical protein
MEHWLRVIACVFIWSTCLYWLIVNTRNYFFLLTHWNWFLLGIHFSLGFDFKNRGSIWISLERATFSIIQPLCWMVTLLYWSLLSDEVFSAESPLSRRFAGAFMHSVNLLLAVLSLYHCRFKLKYWELDCIYSTFTALAYFVLILVARFSFGRTLPYAFMESIFFLNGRVNITAILLFTFTISLVLVLLYCWIVLLQRLLISKSASKSCPV